MNAAALGAAMHLASSELGMLSASFLLVRETATEGGDKAVATLRELLGLAYPVLDTVAARWLAGQREVPGVSPQVIEACRGAERILVVGLEATLLDQLVPELRGARLLLLRHEQEDIDWRRVAASYPGATLVDLDTFQRQAGARSILLTFVYGIQGKRVVVPPVWLRVAGPDVRVQFRSLIGWDVLGQPMTLHPRWLADAPAELFTELV